MTADRLRNLAILAVTLVAAAIYMRQGRVPPTLDGGLYTLRDPFQDGEFYAAAQAVIRAQTPAPLTIHGALDFLPWLLCRALWGPDHDLITTYGLYTVLGIVAPVSYAALLGRMPGHTPRPTLWLSLALLGVVCVGYRDLLLLVLLFAFSRVQRIGPAISDRSAEIRYGMLGVVMALSMFWSFDRGLVGLAAIGAGVTVMAVGDRRAWACALGFGIALLVLRIVGGPFFGLGNYLESVAVLAQTSDQWRYPMSGAALILTVFAIVTNLLALAIFWGGRERASSNRQLADAIASSLVLLGLLKIGINRADIGHIHFSLWLPGMLAIRSAGNPVAGRKLWMAIAMGLILFGLYLWRAFSDFAPLVIATALFVATAPSPAKGPTGSIVLRVACWGMVVVAGWSLAIRLMTGLEIGRYDWIAALRGPQTNEQSATPDMRWLAGRIRASGAGCLFDMSNSGVLNALTGLPSCTRFTYPVYVGSRQEGDLISEVDARRPPLIVYSSTSYAYTIDGRSMVQRFPRLNERLLQMYPVQECRFGYCIRSTH